MNIRPFVALTAALSTSAVASASFHFMQIEQIIGGVGGNTNAQAVQLRLRFAGQNQVQQGRIVSRDAAGLNPIILCDMTTPVPQSAGGTRILISTAAFNALCTPAAVPNFTMTNAIPASRLNAGRITFEGDTGTIYWSVAYGGTNYTGANTGSTTNDADGNFGAPFSGPLPTSAAQALRLNANADAVSTNNAAQYTLTAANAVFNNSAGTAFTVTPPPPPGPTDFNEDGFVEPGDLDEFITAFFSENEAERALTDFNGDGFIEPGDLDEFITSFFDGC
ncbi:MAG: hypothetical protein ACT4PL_06490 [Phycisphaerales bacterium]